MSWWKAITAVGLACCVMSGQVRAEDDLILSDFEDEADLSRWRVEDQVGMELSADWSSRGSRSLKLTYAKFVDGQTPTWPYVQIAGDALIEQDWRDYAYVRLDKYVQTQSTALLTYYIGPHVGTRTPYQEGGYRIWIDIERMLESEPDYRERVHSFTMRNTRPGADEAVYLDNIRLTNRGPGHGRSAEAVREEWSAMSERLLSREDLFPVFDGPDDEALHVETINTVSREQEESIETIAAMQAGLDLLKADALRDQWILERFEQPGFGALVTSVGEQVRFDGAPGRHWTERARMTAMRGETRSRQLVVWPGSDEELARVRVEFEPLVHEDDAEIVIGADRLRMELIGYVYLMPASGTYEVSFPGPGWYPDPVIPMNGYFDVTAPRRQQPLLLSVQAPRSARPGVYEGAVRLTCEAGRTLSVPIELEVFDIEMPVQPRLAQAHHGLPRESPETALAYRLNPNTWDLGSIYNHHEGPDIERLKELTREGMSYFTLYSIKPYRLRPYIEEHGEEEGVERYLEHIYETIPIDYVEELAEAGLAERALFYGFDEVEIENPIWIERIDRMFGALKRRYGEYGVQTMGLPRDWDNFELDTDHWQLPIDIWVPSLWNAYDRAKARMMREETGRQVWWYHSSWNLWHQPIWSRALGWATYANEAEGWLYYNFMAWDDEDQVLGDDPLTAWDARTRGGRSYGTGGLFYPHESGEVQPSLRIVNLREGFTDYDLLCLLREVVEQRGDWRDHEDRRARYRHKRAAELARLDAYVQRLNALVILDRHVASHEDLKDGDITDALLDELRREAAELIVALRDGQADE